MMKVNDLYVPYTLRKYLFQSIKIMYIYYMHNTSIIMYTKAQTYLAKYK